MDAMIGGIEVMLPAREITIGDTISMGYLHGVDGVRFQNGIHLHLRETIRVTGAVTYGDNSMITVEFIYSPTARVNECFVIPSDYLVPVRRSIGTVEVQPS